ncbi:hypothetical protein PP425_gp073 [Enterobacter phage vB_EclM_Q7622]|uniref:hypothetical protein n=1 Tax=Enterobacter phage vB_EclM_Q7622 TaxID=2908628 RepID=UPI0023293458|nr:hypothetical protein PP425_gp073 [Enterobacter phage vB_EclM_Q7622]UIS65588.1 hypothetical protein Q76222_00073 [Enterobacter phage vB_EclM_Q7622]
MHKLKALLPEGVSVFLVYKVPPEKQTHYFHELSRKISQTKFLELILKNVLKQGIDFRIYPIASKTKYTRVHPDVAWNEGMNLEEFKEYLND